MNFLRTTKTCVPSLFPMSLHVLPNFKNALASRASNPAKDDWLIPLQVSSRFNHVLLIANIKLLSPKEPQSQLNCSRGYFSKPPSFDYAWLLSMMGQQLSRGYDARPEERERLIEEDSERVDHDGCFPPHGIHDVCMYILGQSFLSRWALTAAVRICVGSILRVITD